MNSFITPILLTIIFAQFVSQRKLYKENMFLIKELGNKRFTK